MTFQEANENASMDAVEAFNLGFSHSICRDCTRVSTCCMSDFNDENKDRYIGNLGVVITDCNFFDQQHDSHDL